MDFETFKEELREDVKRALEEKTDSEYSVELHTQEKMNETYDALTIKPEDSEIGVSLNTDSLYKAYSDGMDYDRIVSETVGRAESALANRPDFNIDAFKDYDKMKETLAMEVVSAERNADILDTVPHKNMEDMAIVYRFVVGQEGAETGSILVTNKMLDEYGITPEQLHADAMKNAPEVRPMEIKGMGEVLAAQMGVENLEDLGLNIPPEQEQMYVASVKGNVHGAGVLAYEDFMDKAAERAGGECLGLRWCDLDFKNRIIDINHNLVHRRVDEEGGTLHINTPKTKAGERRIPMIEPVYEAFLEEYQIQQLTGFCTQEIEGYKGFVFCSSGGTVTIPQEVNRAIHTIVADYNEEETAKAKKERREPFLLPKFSAHHLRHTFCTRLCENETNLKVIQTVMGHKDIQTTMDIYADCTEDKKKEVIQKIENKIFVM